MLSGVAIWLWTWLSVLMSMSLIYAGFKIRKLRRTIRYLVRWGDAGLNCYRIEFDRGTQKDICIMRQAQLIEKLAPGTPGYQPEVDDGAMKKAMARMSELAKEVAEEVG